MKIKITLVLMLTLLVAVSVGAEDKQPALDAPVDSSQPICSGGGVFNRVSGMCEMPPIVENPCPAGMTFSKEEGLCFSPVQCPEGSLFDATIKKCVYQGR